MSCRRGLGSYAYAVGPILLGNLVVPPLNGTSLARVDHPLAELLRQLHRESRRIWPLAVIKKHMVFSEHAISNGRAYTALSHLFLHADFSHLLNNTISLVFTGSRVFSHFGYLSFYTVFFGGGVFAALHKGTRQLQLANQTRLPDSAVSALGRVPRLGDWVTRTSSSLGQGYASMMRPRMEYVGCSAGVTALLGVNLCLALEDITAAVMSGSLVDSATALASAGRIALTIAADVQYLSKGAVTGIDHAGHIDGFVWGCSFFVAARLWGWLRAGGGSRRGGRRGGSEGQRLGGGEAGTWERGSAAGSADKRPPRSFPTQ